MAPDDLTPGQLAELLAVDGSTLRRWARQFKQHLSEQANAKRRRYTRADLAVLYRARELLHAGKSPEEVNTLLATAPAPNAQLPATAEVQLPGVIAELEAVRELLRGLGTLSSRIEQLEAAREEDRKRLNELVEDLKSVRRRTLWERILNRWPK